MLEAVGASELGGSWIVLVQGLADVKDIARLAHAFGSEDLGFRRRWEWTPRPDGSGVADALLQIEFGSKGRRWRIDVHFGEGWSPRALVAMASGQLFSFADADRPPPPLGNETRLLLPLMLDIDAAFLGAAGEMVGGTLELCVCVHGFGDEQQALRASDQAMGAMGPLGFIWRLRDASGAFVIVAVAFSRAGAEQADKAMAGEGGTLIDPEGPLRATIEARLWPGVEEGAAVAAGEQRPGTRGGLVRVKRGFKPFGPEVA